jgi:deoxyribose-phosphate aldolase
MRAVAKSATPSVLKVKASGGVGTLEDVRRMVDAGAERIGSSRTERIIQDVLGVGGTGAAGGGSY